MFSDPTEKNDEISVGPIDPFTWYLYPTREK
jgi:hypothetical protein